MALFDEWYPKGHQIVNEVMKELGIEDERKALGKDFASQLPMVLKAVWCDG